MDLNELVRLLRRSWILLVTFTIVGVFLGALASVATTKTYTSASRLFVSVQAPGDSSAVDLVQGSSAAQAKVRSYVDVVTSARVLSPVIDELHLTGSVASLAGRIKAASPANSVLITISATDTDPARAARLANAVSASFTKVVVDGIEAPTVGTASLVRIETIEQAIPAASPHRPSPSSRSSSASSEVSSPASPP